MSDETRKELLATGKELLPGQFVKGAKVVLRSGGPVMTVSGLAVGAVECIWFMPSMQAGKIVLPVECLEFYKAPTEASDATAVG